MTRESKAPSLLQRFLVALLVVAAASVFRALFFGGLGRGIPFLLYFPAVTLASLYGGLSAGSVATAFSATLAYFLVQRTELLPAEFLALAIFVISGILIAGVCEAMHRSHRRAAQALGKAEAVNRQLLDGIAERKQAEEALRLQAEQLSVRNATLERFNAVAVGRELRMIELKHEVNELCGKLHEPPRHQVAKSEPAPPAEQETPA